MHARTPKNFVLEERLERYADAIELCPRAYAGRWAEACWPLAPGQAAEDPTGFERVVLDLGCGKGVFACEAAAAEIAFVPDPEPAEEQEPAGGEE
jgi:tRNA (guanine-N7-)-methyltransferase